MLYIYVHIYPHFTKKVGILEIRKFEEIGFDEFTIVKYIASDFCTLPHTQSFFTGIKAAHPWVEIGPDFRMWGHSI